MTNFGLGLRVLGLESGCNISMYAETRAEWIISCLGAFSQNIHVCTVYTNLGDEAVIHALNETEVIKKLIQLKLHMQHCGIIKSLSKVFLRNAFMLIKFKNASLIIFDYIINFE